jgi:hypothetical protein
MSSHMLAMPGMRMEATAANHSDMRHERSDDLMNSGCCDAITPCPLGMDLFSHESASIISYGDTIRVLSPISIIRIIYLKTLSPPPKA